MPICKQGSWTWWWIVREVYLLLFQIMWLLLHMKHAHEISRLFITTVIYMYYKFIAFFAIYCINSSWHIYKTAKFFQLLLLMMKSHGCTRNHLTSRECQVLSYKSKMNAMYPDSTWKQITMNLSETTRIAVWDTCGHWSWAQLVSQIKENFRNLPSVNDAGRSAVLIDAHRWMAHVSCWVATPVFTAKEAIFILGVYCAVTTSRP